MPFGPVVPATHKLLQRIPLTEFDGNLGDQCRNILQPTPQFTGVTKKGMLLLMKMTVQEHDLAWVLIPPYGYRL